MTFPTAVFDLQPVVAGYDRALAWMSLRPGLRQLGGPVARWSRRLILHVQDVHRQRLRAERVEDQAELLCLRICNGARGDASRVRVRTRWQLDSPWLNVRTAEGQWLDGTADHGPLLARGAQEVFLGGGSSARVLGQYVALAVKYWGDHDAYLVTPDSHRRYLEEERTWRWPTAAMGPGRYDVSVGFRARDGAAAGLRLTVTNPGRRAALGATVTIGQSLAS